ncbi:RodZ domain-containing protein [Oceanospirillum sediminis]|uniref:Helix-turn-helix domain-containing protein n=1 Tax=Oceanospirillum sediminis TaxID=2760088 RepID=A0A839IMR0_9GAMM|nr:RodZ domain-containing protein [Oceanospirillum sediminis]MBB1485586.1 helix-turn-helix domain-containing protein [Oceanospirillum sediminis]
MTENIAPKEELQQNDSSPVMPGDLLKEGRERAGMSTEDVASKLNLKHSFVVQIEENNFDHLPGPTFIRGYLRAYSKLIDLDADPVIAAFNTLATDTPVDTKGGRGYKPVDTIRPQRNLSDPLIKYTTLIILAAIIGFSVIWWQSRNGGELSLMNFGQSDTVAVDTSDGETVLAPMNIPESAEEADGVDGTGDPVEATDQQSIVTGTEASSDDSDAQNDAEDTTVVVTEQNSEQAEETDEAEAESESETAEPVEESPAAEPVVQESTETQAEEAVVEDTPDESAPVVAARTQDSDNINAEPSTSEATAVLAEPAQPLADGLARLVISFTEECWVRVTDARGIKVINNLKKPGETSDVTGVPPFKMMIGNATGASVLYNGQPIDLAQHTNRNNIARFNLGEQE